MVLKKGLKVRTAILGLCRDYVWCLGYMSYSLNSECTPNKPYSSPIHNHLFNPFKEFRP